MSEILRLLLGALRSDVLFVFGILFLLLGLVAKIKYKDFEIITNRVPTLALLVGTGLILLSYLDIQDSLNLPPILTSPSATAPPDCITTPLSMNATQVNFPRGSESCRLVTSLSSGVVKSYILRVLAQQRMVVSTDDGTDITVLNNWGELMTPETSGEWVISLTGDYTIVVVGNGQVVVDIYIR